MSQIVRFMHRRRETWVSVDDLVRLLREEAAEERRAPTLPSGEIWLSVTADQIAEGARRFERGEG